MKHFLDIIFFRQVFNEAKDEEYGVTDMKILIGFMTWLTIIGLINIFIYCKF